MNPKQQKSGYINQVSSKHEAPEPCKTLPKPTPAEALRLGIKLPWEGKVQRMRPEDLTKELFMGLEAYGVTRLEISVMFHFYGNKLQPMLREWNIPRAPTGGANRAVRSGNMEKPQGTDTVIRTRPGQTKTDRIKEMAREAKILTEAEMDEELAQIDKRLAELDCKMGENYSPKEQLNIPTNIPPDDADPISTPSTDQQAMSTNPESVDIAVEVPHIASREEVRQFFVPNEDGDGLNYQDRYFLGLTEKEKAVIDPVAVAIDAETQQLETYLLQGASELGSFPAAGLQIGLLVASKQQQYGDTISAMGPLLRVLYPDGIGHDQYDDLALIVRILDKIGRITKGNGQGSEDAWGDLAGYALLGQAGLQRKSA